MDNENLIDISTRADHKELSAKGGRNKKGSKNLKTVLKELLSAQDPEGEWANPVVKKLLQLAFNKGDYRALVEIIDRIEGKPKQDALVENHTHFNYEWNNNKDTLRTPELSERDTRGQSQV